MKATDKTAIKQATILVVVIIGLIVTLVLIQLSTENRTKTAGPKTPPRPFPFHLVNPPW